MELANLGYLKFLISQNVDNLHIKSGIKPELIAELHGNYTIMKCFDCDTRYTREEIGWNRQIHGRGHRNEISQKNQPKCPKCDGRIISSVINFNDPMPEKEMALSKEHTNKCDLMIVVGSSLAVQPAASFPHKAKRNGAKLVIINNDSTPLDKIADVKIDLQIGDFLPKVVEKLKSFMIN